MKAAAYAALALLLWSNPSRAADYVVHVSIIDESAVTYSRVERTDKLLKKMHPDLELRSVPVFLDDMTMDEALEKVRVRLEEIPFLRGERVKLLVVNAPAPVGALDVLEGKLSSYARVVSLGHRGEDPTALLNALGAPDGSAFTLETPPTRSERRGLTRARAKVIGLMSLGIGLTGGALAVALREPDAAVPVAIAWSLYSAGVLAASVVVWEFVRPLLSAVLRRTDVGRVVRLRDGKVVGERRVSALRRGVIFACEDRLTR